MLLPLKEERSARDPNKRFRHKRRWHFGLHNAQPSPYLRSPRFEFGHQFGEPTFRDQRFRDELGILHR